MIRINLLPVRAAKKKESIRFQITIASLATIFVLSLAMVFTVIAGGEVRALSREFKAAEKELKELKKKTGELEKIEDQKRLVQAKLDSIKKLEDGRTGPLDMFEKLGDVIPEQVWIETLGESSHTITLKGLAATEEDISEFLRGLQKKRDLGMAELVVAQMDKSAVKGRDLFSFTIRIDR